MAFFKHLMDVRSAKFSEDRTYRYHLLRTWNSRLPRLVVIGLNPSTADERTNDATISRCIQFAKLWGMGGLDMLNLFAFCATRPRDMMRADDPIGVDNDATIRRVCKGKQVGCILAAWGVQGFFMGRDLEVASLLLGYQLDCLQITAGGFPQHPLFLRGDTQPQPYLKHHTSTLAWILRKHTSACGYRIRAESVSACVCECEPHYKACPVCTPCTCGIGEDRGF